MFCKSQSPHRTLKDDMSVDVKAKAIFYILVTVDVFVIDAVSSSQQHARSDESSTTHKVVQLIVNRVLQW